MKVNKHEINGYIYVTSDEEIKQNDFISNGFSIGQSIVFHNIDDKKIILTNNPNLSIQQLTTEEVEYLKSVDSFEIEKEDWVLNPDVKFFYKILIPQETENKKDEIDKFFVDMVCNPKEQPKESIEELALKYAEENQYDLEYYDEGGYQGIEVKSFAEKLVDFFNKHKKQ